MASKRKSTTPCMVRASEVVEQDDLDDDDDVLINHCASSPPRESNDDWVSQKENSSKECEILEGKPSIENQSKKLVGGYECKYCPYSTLNLSEFTEHVDMQHPNVILNPLYVCAECNFTTKKYDCLSDHNIKFHPGENNFKLKLMKRNNQTVLEQSIEGNNNTIPATNSSLENNEDDENMSTEISISKTPIMKMIKTKQESKKGCRRPEEAAVDINTQRVSPCFVPETTNISSYMNGNEMLQDGFSHVMPSVQLPPNINLLPKVPVPLNSNKYNCALDTNTTLINAFNKFPYPTQAELSWLTAASKHPEEQIRIWFATQRLKHGISWSPEEVEEARKKMFNGTIQHVPQAFTVLPTQLTSSTTTKMSQPLIQTALPCQILGQAGLVLAQVTNGSAVACPPFTFTVAGAANQSQKRPLQNEQINPEVKRPHTARAHVTRPYVTPSHVSRSHNDEPEIEQSEGSPSTPRRNIRVGTPPNERKKTKEQITALKSSFLISPFPDNAEVYKLINITGLSRSDIKKWFSDHRYRTQKGIVNITSESIEKDQTTIATRSSREYHIFPEITRQTDKEKIGNHLKILESSFTRSSFPTQVELERLKAETKLNRREIDSWFKERRKIRDNMEQAVLDSMGSHKRTRDHGTQNGSINQSGRRNSPDLVSYFSVVENRSKQEQLHFLKSTFARTQWPSPQEYDQLAYQTGLVRTEIVRWFKENRYFLKSGNLKWMDQYQNLYNRTSDQNDDEESLKVPGSPKNGLKVLKQYYDEHKELNEEHLDRLVMRSKMSYEQVRDWFSQKQSDEAMYRLGKSGHKEKGSMENDSGGTDRVEVGDEDEEAGSDGTNSWSPTAQEAQADLGDSDSESTS
ncbi:zinc fingers and homeoboxes protein 2 [Ambystoma mexicanum]